MLALVLTLTLSQAADGAEIRALVERLRSDNAEERDRAASKLKSMGKASIPELERAATHPDPEGSRRAARLLRVIVVAETLSPTIRKTFPGIEERLTAVDLHAWTEEFLAICAEAGAGKKHAALQADDFRGLVGPAVRGAQDDLEKSMICARAGILSLTSGAPELTPLLRDRSADVRQEVLRTFRILEARQVSAEILPLLKDGSPRVRKEAAESCGFLGVTEAIRPLIPLLEDADEDVRWCAVVALTRLGAREAIPGIVLRLKEEARSFRRTAAWSLGELDACDAAGQLVPLLEDPQEEVRLAAAGALCRLGSFAGVRLLLDEASRDKGVQFWMLNDLRAPATMKRLRETKCRWPFPDRKEAVLGEVIRGVTGLNVDRSRLPDSILELEAPSEIMNQWRTAADTVHDSQVVLESDRIVYMPREEALRFWKDWAGRNAPSKK